MSFLIPTSRQRWFDESLGLAAALIDIEPRLRRVKGYRHLPQLRNALMNQLTVEDGSKNEAA